MMTLLFRTLLVLAALQFAGCATVQYAALEKVGVHKRDILIDRIKEARNSQAETKDQVVTAYEQFRTLVAVDDRGLEKQYKTLVAEVTRSEDKAATLDKRITAVESVARDLFIEWEAELAQYTNPALKDQSRRNLQTTQTRYEQMRQRMRSAQARIAPVLHVLQDQTLYLKHNLNARAVASLQGEVRAVESKVSVLITEMEAAVLEAERFVQGMGSG
ncbi:MAG: DUF2959 family protein [Thiotrichales bacterium]